MQKQFTLKAKVFPIVCESRSTSRTIPLETTYVFCDACNVADDSDQDLAGELVVADIEVAVQVQIQRRLPIFQ